MSKGFGNYSCLVSEDVADQTLKPCYYRGIKAKQLEFLTWRSGVELKSAAGMGTISMSIRAVTTAAWSPKI